MFEQICESCHNPYETDDHNSMECFRCTLTRDLYKAYLEKRTEPLPKEDKPSED